MKNFKSQTKGLIIFVLITLFLGATTTYAWRKIYGKVTSSRDGKPMVGVTVKAYDSDINADDFMGSARTNSRGEYLISYRGGTWDSPKVGIAWRPDIYIKIIVPEHHRFKSRVYNNWKLVKDLKINANVKSKLRARTKKCPDLVITNLTASPTHPYANSPTTMRTIRFTATVKNIGNDAAAASVLAISVGKDSTPERYSIPALAPNETKTVYRDQRLNAVGKYTTTAYADYFKSVSECRESNNKRSINFTLKE